VARVSATLATASPPVLAECASSCFDLSANVSGGFP